MYNGKTILAIVPARGGSKGLPKKNIKEMNGKPLIYWTLKRAKESKFIDDIFISTDSAEIAEICDKVCDKEVGQLRPNELAQDSTSSAEVIKYTIEHLEAEGKTYDYVILLEPTSPLRKEEDIDNIIKIACDNPQSDGVISLGNVHMEHPMSVKKINEEGNIIPYLKPQKIVYQRQQMDMAYFPYGVAYLIKTKVFLKYMTVYTENILPYYIERWQTYEVDDIYDFICIEAIMKNRERMNDYDS